MRFIIIASCLMLVMKTFAQSQNDPQTKGAYELVYELNTEEASKIALSGNVILENLGLHIRQPIDTIWSNNPKTFDQPNGFYIRIGASKQSLTATLELIQDFEIKKIPNGNWLEFVLIENKSGQIRSNQVFWHNRQIKFDDITNSYRIKPRKKSGVVQVTHNGSNAIFPVDQGSDFRGSFFRRVGKKIIYSAPIKVLWTPFRDIYKSIHRGYASGIVYSASRIFKPSQRYKKVAFGYLVLNKPMFKPEDTLRYKFKLAKGDGRSFKRRVTLTLDDYNRTYYAEKLKLKKGQAEGYIVLKDSLNLRLDKSYNLSVDRKSITQVMAAFDYEDYTLHSETYSLKLKHEEHSVGNGNVIYLSGKDENKQRVQNSRYEVSVEVLEIINGTTERQNFVPNLLYQTSGILDPQQDTEVNLPDSIFPKANIEYEVRAAFTNAANERVERINEARFSYDQPTIRMEIIKDSVHFSFPEQYQGPKKLRILGETTNAAIVVAEELDSPWRVKLNPSFEKYAVYLTDQTFLQRFNVIDFPAEVKEDYHRTTDSLQFHLDNLRSLPLWYTLYREKHKIDHGYTDGAHNIKLKAKNRDLYTLQYRYLWTGKIQKKELSIPYYDRQLYIDVDQQQLITPGATDSISLHVIDHKGRPVPNVDITSLSLTSKFKIDRVPNISYFGDQSYINFKNQDFEVPRFFGDNPSLDFDAWRKALGLDSLLYYQVTKPDDLFVKNLKAPGHRTQFSVFSTDHRKLHNVAYIKLDDELVFIHFSGFVDQYVFDAKPGYHKVEFRTDKALISLDSIYFKEGYKTLISVPDQTSDPRVERISPDQYHWRITDEEYQMLLKHTLYIQTSETEPYEVVQGNNRFKLRPRESTNQVGPLVRDSVSVILHDKTVFKFLFEPGYIYEILGYDILRKAYDGRNFGFANIGHHEIFHFLPDPKNTAQNVSGFKPYKQTATRIPQYHFSKNPDSGLLVVHPDSITLTGLRKVFVLPSENQTDFKIIDQDLMAVLDSGHHSLAFVYDSSFVMEEVYLRGGGTTFFIPENKSRFSFSSPLSPVNENDAKQDSLRRLLRPEIITVLTPQFNNPGLITGRVTEGESGEPLGQVTVMIKGTTQGQVTDAEGNYSINVPNNAVLIFRYLGYTQQEIAVGYQNIIDIEMYPEVSELDEVVITAYERVPNRRLPSDPISIERILQGKVQGVDISTNSEDLSKNKNVIIRGYSSISGSGQPLFIIDGVPYSGGDFSNLSPDNIEDISVVKGSSATSIYGIAGRNGVVIITTKKANQLQVQREQYVGGLQSPGKSLRDNFRDYAFWKPTLTTDKNGRVSFEVTYPDDVTAWESHFLAMDNRGFTGQIKTFTKAYKPIIARLSTPRFLVEGDSSIVYGTISNYTGNSTLINRTFETNGQKTKLDALEIDLGHVDSLQVMAPSSDSLTASYLFEAANMSDGELRKIPLLKKGLQQTTGQLHVLESDTSFIITPDQNLGDPQLTVVSDLRNLMLADIRSIHAYAYWCNEQTASKLIALLAEKELLEKAGGKFRKRGQVNSLIQKLKKRKNTSNTWGWWPGMPTSFWVTNHVLKSLKLSEIHGFKTRLDLALSLEAMSRELPVMRGPQLIETLKTIADVDSTARLLDYIELAGQQSNLSLTDQIRLRYLEFRSYEKIDLNFLDPYKKESVYGGIYFKESSESHLSNDLLATLSAYELLKAVGSHERELMEIRKYLMLNRSISALSNTYASSNIIHTIGKDLETTTSKSSININGQQLEKLPFQKTYDLAQSIIIDKSSDETAYITVTQSSWNTLPVGKTDFAAIHTRFIDQRGEVIDTLKKGNNIILHVTLDLTEAAEFVMLEVPIPAGTNYSQKQQTFRPGTHREYFKEKVNFYFENLESGEHKFEIPLNVQYPGNYTLNPAKMALMYQPLITANNESKRVTIN